MMKIDLHIHSKYSEDASGSPEEIMKHVKKKGLHGMAITDHNSIKGGEKAKNLSTKGFIVIPGVEISTTQGHIIGLNVKKDIPKNRSVSETIEHIYDAGGIPIIPHLFRNMSGIKENNLKMVLDNISAIEVYNSCSLPNTNWKTSAVAKKYKLGGTGGSDSHEPPYAGSAYTIIDTTDMNIDTILSEIERKRTWGNGTTLPLSYRRDRMVKSLKQFFQRGLKRI
ncbi:MAG: metal-dependent phosphoesterase [Thermoplasmata archaeon]|nr:MAG: metal-dependent phosphoesterase [Thermoplasmata archaeon]